MGNSLAKFGSNGRYTAKKKKETESTDTSSTLSSYKAPSNSIAKKYGSNGSISDDSSSFKSAYEFKPSTPFKSSIKPVVKATVLKPTISIKKTEVAKPSKFKKILQTMFGDPSKRQGRVKPTSKEIKYNKFKAENPDTPNFLKPLGYALETPHRIAPVQRLMNKTADFLNIDMVNQKGKKIQPMTTKNKIVDSAIDMGGAIVGSAFTGTPGNNLLTGTDKIAEMAGMKLAGKTGKKFLGSYARGSVDAGLSTALEGVAKGRSIKETAKQSAINSVFGGAMFSGGSAISSKLNKIKPSKIETPKIETPTESLRLKRTLKQNIPTENMSPVKPIDQFREVAQKIETPKVNNPKGTLKPQIVKMKSDTMPLVDRTFENVGNKKVNAYQYDNPTLKPYIKNEANIIKGELERTLKPSKGANNVNGESIGYGNKRVTSESMAIIKDTTGASYEKINKALDDIVVDHGRENNALAKKVELVIDDRLSNGYREDVLGSDIPSHGEYLQEKKFINDMPSELNTSTFKKANQGTQRVLKPTNTITPMDNQLRPTVAKNDMLSTNMDMDKGGFNLGSEQTFKTPEGIEMSGQPAKVSKVYSNTLKNTDLMSKVEKDMLDTKDFSYDPYTEKMSMAKAKERIDIDIDGEIKNLNSKEIYSGEDVDTMFSILDSKLLKEARETGNYTESKNFLKNIRKAGTEGGRTSQSFAKYSRTPEGQLIKAQRAIDAVEDGLKKSNPNLIKDIETQTKQIMKDISQMTDKQKEARLKQIFGKKNKAQTKSVIEKVNELIELGAYDKESLRDLIKAKEGIPTLESSDIKFINDHMKLANDAIPDSYENRMELAKVGGLIAEKTPSTNMEKLQAAQRISMLFNPKTTIVRNPLGNTLLNTAESIKNIPGAAIDRVVSGVRKSERTTILVPITKGKAALKGAKQGINEWRMDIKNGVDTGVTGGGMELPNKSKIFNESAKNPVQRIINKSANKLHGIVAKSLKLGDTPFYNAAYSERIAELKIIRKTNVVTDLMKEEANLYGLERTLQNDSAMSSLFTGIKKGNYNGKHSGAETVHQLVANLILPFAKTPANVLDKFLDYSPVGILKATGHGLATKGKGTFNQKKFVDTMARGLTGTGLAFVGYKMAEKDLITGARNKNAKTENFETSLGKANYAFKIGDKYQTVDWALPAAAPLMMGADIFNSLKKSKSMGGALADGTGSAVNLMFNSTLLQGPSRLLGGYNPAASLASGLLGTTTQATPTFGNQLRQLKDPYVRETFDENPLKQTVNKLVNRVPGLSTSLPKKINTSGDDIKNFQGKNNVFNVMLNPGFNTKYNATATQKEIMRLYDDSGETDQVPGIASKVINKTKNNPAINLTGEEFSAYQKLIGETTIKAYNEIIGTTKYVNSDDTEKASMLASAMSKAKAQAKEDTLRARGQYEKGGY